MKPFWQDRLTFVTGATGLLGGWLIRQLLELGADIVKVVYTGTVDSFTEVVQGCPVPVVIAGGEKMDSDEDIFKMVAGALKAGASGVSIGRNAFQHKKPDKMVAALCKMVHHDASVEEAITTLQS